MNHGQLTDSNQLTGDPYLSSGTSDQLKCGSNSNYNERVTNISPFKASLKEILLGHVKCTNFKFYKGVKFHKTIRQDIKNSTTLLLDPNALRTRGYADNKSLWSCEAGHEDEHKFGKCSSCDKCHS